ncbi:MAG: prepilin-type N-terminal cleavage/methylation domain-containing protein [Candidatus Eremiobacteraeota bacterium]|nr:prepilin-type N-terminal cleavage/methylation domain-containing protein [Candidatus Eremiobacteraeota bacterium]
MADARGALAGKKPREKGLSLLEVLFTFALLSLIMMALFNVFPGTLMAVRHAEHRLVAATFAQSMLEGKRVLSFSTIDDPPLSEDRPGDDGTIYHLVFEVFDVTGANTLYLKGIRAAATWQEKDKSYTITEEQYVSAVEH